MNPASTRVEKTLRGFAAAALACVVGACASMDPFTRAADAASPAADSVEARARSQTGWPRWADFPPPPRDVPTDADIRNRVTALHAADADLERRVAAIQWTLGPEDGRPWAERMRNRINPALSRPIDARALAEALAEADRLRARAAPPAPITD